MEPWWQRFLGTSRPGGPEAVGQLGAYLLSAPTLHEGLGGFGLLPSWQADAARRIEEQEAERKRREAEDRLAALREKLEEQRLKQTEQETEALPEKIEDEAARRATQQALAEMTLDAAQRNRTRFMDEMERDKAARKARSEVLGDFPSLPPAYRAYLEENPDQLEELLAARYPNDLKKLQIATQRNLLEEAQTRLGRSQRAEAQEEVKQAQARQIQDERNAAQVLKSADTNIKTLQEQLFTASAKDQELIRGEISNLQNLRQRAYDTLLKGQKEKTEASAATMDELAKVFEPARARVLALRLARSGQEQAFAQMLGQGLGVQAAIQQLFPDLGTGSF